MTKIIQTEDGSKYKLTRKWVDKKIVEARKNIIARDFESEIDFQYVCDILDVKPDSVFCDYIWDYLFNGGNIKQLRKNLAKYKKNLNWES